MTEPKWLRKLQDAVGTATATGDLIGMTGGSVAQILRENECRITTELAAQFLYEKKYAPKPGKLSENLIICQAPEDKIAVTKEFIRFQNGKIWDIAQA